MVTDFAWTKNCKADDKFLPIFNRRKATKKTKMAFYRITKAEDKICQFPFEEKFLRFQAGTLIERVFRQKFCLCFCTKKNNF